ncbi:MAG: hypothetical protein WC700_18050 [Gemmatimonadaceae bacterium]|jgi:hypothetical protein
MSTEPQNPNQITENERLALNLAHEQVRSAQFECQALSQQFVAAQARGRQAAAEIEAQKARLFTAYQIGPSDQLELATGEIKRNAVPPAEPGKPALALVPKPDEITAPPEATP